MGWIKLYYKVDVWYLAFIFCGYTTVDNLLKAFQEATSKLELDKMSEVLVSW